MAEVHNGIKYATGVLNALALGTGVSRDQAGVERLGETLTPVIDIYSLPEWSVLRGEELGAVSITQPAVAAEFPIVAFGNLLGSGVILTLEAASFTSATVMSVGTELAADTIVAGTLGAAAFPVLARDRRFKNPAKVGRGFLKIGTDPAATFGVVLEINAVSTANQWTPFLTTFPIILQPGDDLLVIGKTVNASLGVSLKWKERQALPGELG